MLFILKTEGRLTNVGRLFDYTFSQWGIVRVDKVEIERQTIWEQRGHRIVEFESRFTERVLQIENVASLPRQLLKKRRGIM